jgi:hypothetical protein
MPQLSGDLFRPPLQLNIMLRDDVADYCDLWPFSPGSLHD